jgi:membrane-associated phospholipid phosphatase
MLMDGLMTRGRLLPIVWLLAITSVAAQDVASDRGSASAAATQSSSPADVSRPAPSLLRDTRRLASRPSVFILAVGGVLAAGAHTVDARTVHALSGNHPLEETLDAGAVLGNGFVQIGGAAAVYGIGSLAHRPAMASLGGELLEAQLLSGAVTQGLKYATRRTRPDGGRRGFPSGHASASFATADVVAERFGWWAGVPAYAAAAYVSASRIADRRHYLSDVMFGAAVGIAAGRALRIPSRGHRLSVFFEPARKGTAVAAAWRLSD